MDNVSRRLSNEDTATSMYLSFDAESTMSTACYKTMDAMSDISTMSSLSVVEGMEELVKMNNKSDDNHVNSTLESSVISPLKTVKKTEHLRSDNPLKALPKNILKEYKALCSTPSREQLLKSVDVTRGSDATRCVDLGLAFLGVEDEKPAYFLPPPVEQFEENKENDIPESEEVSTLSVSSSVEITTSVIERRMLSSMSMASITEEESVEEMNVAKMLEEVLKVNNANILKDANEFNEKVKGATIGSDHCKEKDTITEFLEKTDESTPKVKEIILTKSKLTGKPKIALLSSRNTRRSVCEPNLQTNRPSRIANSGLKRQSLLPTSSVASTQMDAETEIPILMSRMLKISDNTSSMQVDEFIKKEEPIKEHKRLVAPNEKRRSMMTYKTRTSLIPSAPGEKRPFSFTQRMSVVVKTTLNSPARKIARKSTMGTTNTSIQRRSIMPTKSYSDECSKVPNKHLETRKSMLPKPGVPMSNKTTIKKLASVKECTAPSIIERKPQYHTSKVNVGSKIKPPSGISYHKPDNCFICNVCKEKFRIKSLLDAHKLFHENDNATPAFMKKPVAASSASSTSSSLSGNSNQCKYCDKKFALVRALHIHLLQNCSKIPPADKRKLQYTDLNHVEKAQLPNVFTHNHVYQQSMVTLTSATPINVVKQQRTFAPKSSSESLNDNDVQKSSMDVVTVDVSNKIALPHGSVQKIKKNTAHAGVYRTPSKMVPCHLCKLTFKSILDYTNHSLTAHGCSKTYLNSDEDNEVEEVQ